LDQSDQEFVDILRTAVAGYLEAVDAWEAAYNRFYRLPGQPYVVGSDMAAEQLELDKRRGILRELAPRAGQLCLKHGLANPFPGLLRSSLGQYAPQQRVESGIGRNERTAVMACLEQLTDAIRRHVPAHAPGIREVEAPVSDAREPRFSAGRVIVGAIACAVAVTMAVELWPRGASPFPAQRNTLQGPFGTISGNDQHAAWEAERKRESAKFTDADLERMVAQLFVREDRDRVNFHGLLYAGARPLPFLLRALDDPRTWNTVFEQNGFDPVEISPFSRICSLLTDLAPAGAVKPLARYLDHPDPVFRGTAAVLAARIGTVESLELVKKSLADPDRRVREMALIGVKKGLDHENRDEQLAAGVFAAVTPLLDVGSSYTESPASVLMTADPVRAVPILESPKYFASWNPQLREVLEALNRKDVKVPREILLPLMAELEPLATAESPGEWKYAAALRLYANNPDDRAEGRFRDLLQSPSSTIASTAAEGLEVLAGIDARDAVWDAYNVRGFAAMTKPQQLYFAVMVYVDEVNNGGHHQYFYNDESDLFDAAIEGLRALGAPGKAAILVEAGRAFAPGRPAPHESPRRKQMADFGGREDRIFEAADAKFFQSEKEPGERLDVLMTLYASKYRGDFVSAVGR